MPIAPLSSPLLLSPLLSPPHPALLYPALWLLCSFSANERGTQRCSVLYSLGGRWCPGCAALHRWPMSTGCPGNVPAGTLPAAMDGSLCWSVSQGRLLRALLLGCIRLRPGPRQASVVVSHHGTHLSACRVGLLHCSLLAQPVCRHSGPGFAPSPFPLH